MKKAKEDSDKIESALELFQSFVQYEKRGFNDKLMQILNNDYAFKNSFDLYKDFDIMCFNKSKREV